MIDYIHDYLNFHRIDTRNFAVIIKNMKHRFVIILACAFGSMSLQAQDAKVSSIEINKVTQPCVVAKYPINATLVDGAMRKKMSDAKLGSGDKTKDGFRVYKGVYIPEITPAKMDVYYKVEANTSASTLYMLTSKGYDNFMKMDPDSEAIKNTIQYLNAFVKDATAFMVSNDIEKQKLIIVGTETQIKNLEKENESLNKKKTKLNTKINDNNIECSALKSVLESQQELLKTAQAKTATIDQVDALKKEVAKQESQTQKANKNYNKALSKTADLKQDLAELEKSIQDNKTEQLKQQEKLDAEKKRLSELQTQLGYLK